MRVFLAGGSGLVGQRLAQQLRELGREVFVLSRRPDVVREHLPGCTVVGGDPTEPGDWIDTLATCDAVVNLTGESIFAERWTTAFKARLRDSRIHSTELIVQALKRLPPRPDGSPRVLVNASAIGYYGDRGDTPLTEADGPGDDEMAGWCVEWERVALAGQSPNLRVAVLRIGVVLDARGGMLGQLLPIFRCFLGGPVGSGRQWLSWVHHADLTRLLLQALDDRRFEGPFNATAPNPVTNRTFSHTLGRVLHRPGFWPAPGFAVRIMLGEVAQVVLAGQRVLPERAQQLGFSFLFDQLEPALRDVLGR